MITPIRNRYQYSFIMNDFTDLSARVVLNTGTSTDDVYVDDIVVFAVAPGDFDKDGTVKLNDFAVLASQWMQTGSGLTADLDEDDNVDMDDLLIFINHWSFSLSFPAAAPGDFDKDGAVKLNDFAVIASQWQMTGSGLTADLDEDGAVNMNDLLIFIGNWSLELM